MVKVVSRILDCFIRECDCGTSHAVILEVEQVNWFAKLSKEGKFAREEKLQLYWLVAGVLLFSLLHLMAMIIVMLNNAKKISM